MEEAEEEEQDPLLLCWVQMEEQEEVGQPWSAGERRKEEEEEEEHGKRAVEEVEIHLDLQGVAVAGLLGREGAGRAGVALDWPCLGPGAGGRIDPVTEVVLEERSGYRVQRGEGHAYLVEGAEEHLLCSSLS